MKQNRTSIHLLKASALAVLLAAAGSANGVDMLVYYPNGAAAPFMWDTVSNWYETNTFITLPSVAAGALPDTSQSALIQQWGGISPDNPVIVGSGSDVMVKNLFVGRNSANGGSVGAGASLMVSNSILDVTGNLYLSYGNYTYGTLWLRNHATLNVAGNAQIGENNYTTAGHCRVEIDETSKMNVAGLMTVGRRARCISNVVTNRGKITAVSMMLGPCSDANVGTGIVHNAGTLAVSDTLNIGGVGYGGSGGASSGYCWSRGELVLTEGSKLELGDSAKIYVGGISDKTYGDGILDTSIPIVLTGSQAITIGNGRSGALNGGVLILRKIARLDNSSSLLELGGIQYGKAGIVMYDDASITNVTKIRMSNNSRVHSYIEMHDRSMITNIATIRLGETTGSRNGSRGRIMMDGNSAIHFKPTNATGEGSGLILGTTRTNYFEVVMKDSALMKGMYMLNAATSAYAFEAHLRLEGGRLEFEPHTAATRVNLPLGTAGNNADHGVGSISGYGTITRNDLASPSDKGCLTFSAYMHDYSITADGMGDEHDLDMRAITYMNYNSPGRGNLSGTNGWYAVNEGRLLFPRAEKFVGRADGEPARYVGDWRSQGTNSLGEAVAPALVNSFSLAPTTDVTGGKAYPYAALYAPDRTDYPANVLRSKAGKVVAVWRIGTCTSGWIADDPTNPWTGWTAMKVTFRYDATAFDGKTPVKLYRHEGVEGGGWRLVAKQSVPADDALISATIAPGAGTWDVGWFALVEQPDSGLVISVK